MRRRKLTTAAAATVRRRWASVIGSRPAVVYLWHGGGPEPVDEWDAGSGARTAGGVAAAWPRVGVCVARVVGEAEALWTVPRPGGAGVVVRSGRDQLDHDTATGWRVVADVPGGLRPFVDVWTAEGWAALGAPGASPVAWVTSSVDLVRFDVAVRG